MVTTEKIGTRKKPDPVAMATKGRVTTYESYDVDGIKTKVNVDGIKTKVKVRRT